jgi:hypothetical protein
VGPVGRAERLLTPAVSRGLPQGVSVRELGQLAPPVVRRVHDALLQPAFPSAQLVTLAQLLATYVESDDPEPSAVVLRGDLPVAVMLAERYVSGRVLLLAYLVVSAHERGSGIGHTLVGNVLPSWRLEPSSSIVLAEVEDPRVHPPHERWGDPAARLRFYGREGARLLPVPYFQPSLRPGSPREPGMLLLELHGGRTMPTKLVTAFLDEYVTLCEGEVALTDGPVVALRAAMAALGSHAELWDVERFPEVELPSPVASADRSHQAGAGA